MTCPFNGNDCYNTCPLHGIDGCTIAEMKNLAKINDSLESIKKRLAAIESILDAD